MIKQGSVWVGSDMKKFVVIHVIEHDGHTWVHYRSQKDGQEHSCYQESFEQRFSLSSNE